MRHAGDWMYRGVIRFFLRSRHALPASSRTSAAGRSDEHVSARRPCQFDSCTAPSGRTDKIFKDGCRRRIENGVTGRQLARSGQRGRAASGHGRVKDGQRTSRIDGRVRSDPLLRVGILLEQAVASCNEHQGKGRRPPEAEESDSAGQGN